MLDVQNYDGLLTFLLGMIFLVLVGVGLSLVADRLPSLAAGAESDVQLELTLQEQEIQNLRSKLELTNFQIKQTESSHVAVLEKSRLIEASHEMVVSRRRHLQGLRASLLKSISALEDSFESFRIESRKRAWARAIADPLGDLKTTDGRVFREAVIVGINHGGISIRHADGSASIPASLLSGEYWDRFHWEACRAAGAQTPRVPTPAAPESAPSDQKVKALRAALQRAGENVSRVDNALSDLDAMKAGSNSVSVPGSLDTWIKRKSQLRKDLAEAKIRYAKARTDLQILSPDDQALYDYYVPR